MTIMERRLSEREKIEILRSTLQWIIERIESEAGKNLQGRNAMWKRAARESAEEARSALQMVE